MQNFTWKELKDDQSGLEFVVLKYESLEDNNKSMEAWICTQMGSNLARFKVGNENVIDFEPDVLKAGGFTGNPVLYPTPNRLENSEFEYDGKLLKQIKRGKEVSIHGLVFDEVWEWDVPVISDEKIALKTWIEFNDQSPLYDAFPFDHRLVLQFELSKSNIRTVVSVENEGIKVLPFGFALHPYFIKLAGDEGTSITIPADYVMETYEDGFFPTGKKIDVTGTAFDLRESKKLAIMDFDNDFTNLRQGKPAEITYENIPYKIEISASEEFEHLMLYTPKGEKYFCIENQTCAINAHNFHNRGFIKEANLIFVSSKSTYTGYIDYNVAWDK